MTSGGTYVFDLETKRLANEVGGWSHIDKLGLSAAVLLHTETGEMLRFVEENVQDLIDRLVSAECVVGYNVIRFDYTVLKPYGYVPSRERLMGTVDLLDHIYNALGFRLKLDDVAAATLGVHKSADGLAAVAWYRAGEMDKILAYCEQDVRVTHDVWKFGRANKHIRYTDRMGRSRKLPVEW